MKVGRPNPNCRKELTIRKKILFAIFVTSAFGLFVYVGSIGVRTARLYHFVKDSQRGWRGRALAPDPNLGYAPIPGSTGIELVPMGQALPVRFDDHGFRVPFEPSAAADLASPSALTLGCSFTYGEVCLAEETYTHMLGNLTGCRCMNAGVTSYGLAQMLILAQTMIPAYRPDYVVVQHSPWLVQRAQNFYAHIAFGATPVPFFAETSSGELYVHAPVFRSKAAALSVDGFRGSPASLNDYLSFLLTISGPLLLHDDYHMSVHRIKRLGGFTPRPAANPHKIVDYVYRQIADLCAKYNSKMIILVLGGNAEPVDHEGLDHIPGARIVDAQRALLAKLPQRTPGAYLKTYGHWRGDPPVCVDEHPNAAAHMIIAQELAKAIDRRP
jgi:hypothetical protein